jgi:hypothetical protein
LCIALCALAGALVVLGFVYFLVPVSRLPGVLGVHPHAAKFTRYKVHHLSHPSRKRALVTIALASLPLIGAWWLRYRYDPPD